MSASLSVSGPAYRLSMAQLADWGPSMTKAGLDVSAALGFHPEPQPGRPTAGADARTLERRRSP